MGNRPTLGVVLVSLTLGHLYSELHVSPLATVGKEEGQQEEVVVAGEVLTLECVFVPFARIVSITTSSLAEPNSFSSSCLDAESRFPCAPCLLRVKWPNG